MPLVYACIAPHGYELIPELNRTPAHAERSRAAMAQLGRRMAAERPDTIVILTPHGVRIDGSMCISVCTRAAGSLRPDVSVDFDVDQPLAEAIAEASESAGVPTARCIYGASGGPHSCIPLDWGALIPLRYMGHPFTPKPQVVVVCPSRSLSLEQMVAFGRAIGQVAEQSGKRVALIASSDQGHAHAAEGPYGLDPASAIYDKAMCDAIEANELERLLSFDPALVSAAKPDSLWQTLILHGALRVKPMKGQLLVYEVPTYFGMLCADYLPNR